MTPIHPVSPVRPFRHAFTRFNTHPLIFDTRSPVSTLVRLFSTHITPFSTSIASFYHRFCHPFSPFDTHSPVFDHFNDQAAAFCIRTQPWQLEHKPMTLKPKKKNTKGICETFAMIVKITLKLVVLVGENHHLLFRTHLCHGHSCIQYGVSQSLNSHIHILFLHQTERCPDIRSLGPIR